MICVIFWYNIWLVCTQNILIVLFRPNRGFLVRKTNYAILNFYNCYYKKNCWLEQSKI
jgi:hypothetical protein